MKEFMILQLGYSSLTDGLGQSVEFTHDGMPTLTIKQQTIQSIAGEAAPDEQSIAAFGWRQWAGLLRVIAFKLIEVKPKLFTTELETILMAARLAGLSINPPEIDPCKQHLSGTAAGAAMGLQRRDRPSNSNAPNPANASS